MKKIQTSILYIALFTVLVFSGCNNMSNNPTDSKPVNFLTVSPAENAQDVAVNESITLEFLAPVQPAIIEKNFVIISSKDMNDSTCPQSHQMGHSDMNSAMGNMSMMEHLKDVHATKGTFSWSPDNKKCVFTPDSGLEPGTDYMMFMDKDMMEHMKITMAANMMMNGGMGMMSCNCPDMGNNSNEMMMHFTTKK